MSNGKKRKIVFTMRQIGFLHFSMPRQSAGRSGWPLQLKESLQAIRHMLHSKHIYGRKCPRVQRRHLPQLHPLIAGMIRIQQCECWIMLLTCSLYLLCENGSEYFSNIHRPCRYNSRICSYYEAAYSLFFEIHNA